MTASDIITGYQNQVRNLADDFALMFSHQPTAIMIPGIEATGILHTARQLHPVPETAMKMAGITKNERTGRALFLGYEIIIGGDDQGMHALLVDTSKFGPMAG
jgi:hypothetical protein